MNGMTGFKNNRGFTLIELIISMVVVSIALGGVLTVMNYTVLHSADPMLQHQAVAIAESYLEEVLLHPFQDPDGGSEPGRSSFDDVGDYDGLIDVGARDQNGNAIPGLGSYRVAVNVATSTVNGVAGRRVTVTVRHPTGIDLSLSGFKANY